MRLWTLHPRYLDPPGLVALWREALLAQAVLRGLTKGYRHHPQLQRFQAHPAPLAAISAYLAGVLAEAQARGYSFNGDKVGPVHAEAQMRATTGQLGHEWQHLLHKLAQRSPGLHQRWLDLATPEAHPLFCIQPGAIEPWERPHGVA